MVGTHTQSGHMYSVLSSSSSSSSRSNILYLVWFENNFLNLETNALLLGNTDGCKRPLIKPNCAKTVRKHDCQLGKIQLGHVAFS